MALGGGTFTVKNKVLPGSYINFISGSKASSNLSDRGFATMPLELDWGVDGEVFEVTNADFQKKSLKIFGYEYTHEKMKGLRDLFLNLQTLYAYRLNTGTKAENTFVTARYSGIRGNDFKVVIQIDIDDNSKFNVAILIGNVIVETQNVASAHELLDNDFVIWKKDAVLNSTAGIALEGGTNGDSLTGLSHQKYLDKIESYNFNTMGIVTNDDTIKSLYVNFTKRMRDEVGAKFQLIVHGSAADYEGVINVKNIISDKNWSNASIVYWITGIEAGCKVNKSCLNRVYDGEFTVDADYTQTQLTQAIKDGEFTLHKVGSDVRVLTDINSFINTTENKCEAFKDNQTIRVCDQIANDIAVLFNTKYLGNVPNDESGRISLWADIVKHHEQLQHIRAIENFEDKHVTVEIGETRKAVIVSDSVTVVNAMVQLYMTVKVA